MYNEALQVVWILSNYFKIFILKRHTFVTIGYLKRELAYEQNLEKIALQWFSYFFKIVLVGRSG